MCIDNACIMALGLIRPELISINLAPNSQLIAYQEIIIL